AVKAGFLAQRFEHIRREVVLEAKDLVADPNTVAFVQLPEVNVRVDFHHHPPRLKPSRRFVTPVFVQVYVSRKCPCARSKSADATGYPC
ncbi:MAG: hypothetical protein O6909_01440, partial [Alphaproteobacteria bacterium]|nr:hypothetical protein [Alphaproteobacteria bacterium]